MADEFGGIPVKQKPKPDEFGGVPVTPGIGPSFPQGHGADTLPDMTNEDMANFGRGALKLLPVAGATVATLAAPELSIPAMAGIAALGGAGGQAARQGILAATGSPGAPESFGDAALKTGESGLEQGLGELGGRLIAKPAKWLLDRISPTRLYGSSLRPSPSISPADRTGLIRTGLNEGIRVSDAGLNKLQSAKESLNSQIENAINRGSASGATLDPNSVADLSHVRSRFQSQVNPDADVSAIDLARAQFLRNNPNPIPLSDAQSMKKGTYRVLSGKYGELGSADTEAQKGLARNLRTGIATHLPEVGPLNAREGSLIDLEDPLSRSINREGNRQLIGLRAPMVDNPAVKSGVAIGMNRIANSPVGRILGPVAQPNVSLPLAARTAANGMIQIAIDPKTGKPVAANQTVGGPQK